MGSNLYVLGSVSVEQGQSQLSLHVIDLSTVDATKKTAVTKSHSFENQLVTISYALVLIPIGNFFLVMEESHLLLLEVNYFLLLTSKFW